MVNGLAVLGWGVGGIEAEAAMLGQPYSMLLPEVIGVKLTGKLKEGVTATDLVLTVTQMLRKRGVVGKFVEFFGPGLASLSIADRATIGNMAPEYGATCGFFPVDDDTLDYLTQHRPRRPTRVALVEAYAKAQGMYRTKSTPDPVFTDVLKLELGSVEPSLAGPKRPQDRVALKDVKAGFAAVDGQGIRQGRRGGQARVRSRAAMHDLGHGDVVIAAITSCTNTSNPSVMVARGAARPQGRRARAHRQAVGQDLARARLPGGRRISRASRGCRRTSTSSASIWSAIGCTTCIGNSGPLPPEISKAINDNDLVAAAVLSGNRNFEGRVNSGRARQLSGLAAARRRLCHRRHDERRFRQDAARHRQKAGKKVYPARTSGRRNARDQRRSSRKTITKKMFQRKYADVFKGDANWRKISREGRPRPIAWDRQLDLRAEPALLRRHEPKRPERARPTSSTRACSGCSSIPSPPTTSRRRDRSRQPRRPAST